MLQFGGRVGHRGGLIGPKLFRPEVYPACLFSKSMYNKIKHWQQQQRRRISSHCHVCFFLLQNIKPVIAAKVGDNRPIIQIPDGSSPTRPKRPTKREVKNLRFTVNITNIMARGNILMARRVRPGAGKTLVELS